MIGFIILRHVNSEKTNMYWQESYSCIRKFYDNKIVIIDDNSNYKYITDLKMENTIVIQSEFPGRAELLPYYYLLKNGWFDVAVILHDSVFIQKPIKFKEFNKFLWHFQTHAYDNNEGELKLIGSLKNNKGLIDFYKDKNKWFGCFGVMSIISYNTVDTINYKYNFFDLLKLIKCRKDRMMLERIFSSILSYELDLDKNNSSYFGNIEQFCEWSFKEEFTMDNYLEKKKNEMINLPIVKVWTGR